MAAQATFQRTVEPSAGIFGHNGPFPTRAEQESGPMNLRQGAPMPGILPSDELPPHVKEDPAFREGIGAMYASSQPHLARKYGVVRAGQFIPPQLLTGISEKPTLSPGTLKDLQTLTALSQGPSSPTAAPPESAPLPPPATPEKAAEEVAKRLDDFDYNTFKEALYENILNSEEQKKIIEARLQPLNFNDLLTHGYVTQRVPIIPGQFEPTFQSMRANEDLAIKRLAIEEAKGVEVTEKFLLDKFALMTVVIGLRAINSNVMPDHLDDNGKFNEEKFWRKFEKVAALSFHMISSLGVNYFWFDTRVRKLFLADNLKNG